MMILRMLISQLLVLSWGWSSSSSGFVSAQGTVTNPVCFLCFEGFFPSNLDATATDPSTNEDVTCLDLVQRGQSGLYTPQECTTLQATTFFTCQCAEITTTDVPATSPQNTPRPTRRPTRRPTQRPTEPPATQETLVNVTTEEPLTTQEPATEAVTEVPATEVVTEVPATEVVTEMPATDVVTEMPATEVVTEMPATDEPVATDTPEATDAPVNGDAPPASGSVTIVLRSVLGEMPPNTVDSYEAQTTAFFMDKLQFARPPVTNINCTLVSQILILNEGGSGRNLRSLQSTRPLQTLLRVDGNRDSEGTSDLDILLQDTVNDNQDEFVEYVRNATPPINQVFMKSVESVEAFPAAFTTPEPTLAPSGGTGDGTSATAAEPKKLSTGAIIGIVTVAIMVATLLVSGILFSKRSAAEEEPADMRQDEDIRETVPPPMKSATEAPKVAAAAATGTKLSDLNKPKPVEEKKPTEADAPAPAPVPAPAPAPAPVPAPAAAPAPAPAPADAAAPAAVPAAITTTTPAAAPAPPDGKKRREVVAPPGKLGIVIDTTLEGPVVHKVNPGSPLENILYPGDIIVQIDDVDTRAMSASAITSLMVKTANQNRNLTVLGDH